MLTEAVTKRLFEKRLSKEVVLLISKICENRNVEFVFLIVLFV